MLQSKLLEIRDNFTRIDVIATKMASENSVEHSILRHNGYSDEYPVIIVTRIENGESTNDPFKWGTDRGDTMHQAHMYIRDHFDEIPDLWTVDIETIYDQKSEMKIPERYNSYDKYDNISFSIKDYIEASDFTAVADILASNYNLPSAKYRGGRMISIRKDEISPVGIKFYEVLNQYLDVIK